MAAKKKPAPSGPSRSAITGHFVTPGYAKTHPKTTVTERPKKKR
jgi:hypothetical protein